jgi:hypothetical protein
MMIKHHNYCIKSVSYLPNPGGVFPFFQSILSFPSSTRTFHSLSGITRGCSYLGFFFADELYTGPTNILKYNPIFEVTLVWLKVPSLNNPTNLLISSSFSLELWEFHLVCMAHQKSSKVRSFMCS